MIELKDETKIILAGRHPHDHEGAVNTPVYHASTILYPNLAAIRGRQPMNYTYGRRGTPTTKALEEAMCEMEGAAGCVLTPSGTSAVCTAILSVAKAGDHILMVDTAYFPTRSLCDEFLSRMGIETEYYDPLIGGDIQSLFRDNTSLVFMESPGSQSFEVQDVRAICAAAQQANIKTALDNTWASPYFCKPLALGVDLSIQAATKYIIGHADALLGTVCANKASYTLLRHAHGRMGLCAAPDDVFLALRGLRTLPTRLKQHQESALNIAHWLADFGFVREIFYPAMPEAAGHTLWKRDFTGAAGLFAFELDPCGEEKLAAMLDQLELFGMGYSWGGFESLIVPGEITRTVTAFDDSRLLLRVSIGLENPEDLKNDLYQGFIRSGYLKA
jgi:cystathionine beta-lyase